MEISELRIKIEKKKADIEKRKNISLKLEMKLETLTDGFDIRITQSDLKSSNYKLKELEIQLENLQKQYEKEKAKNEVERIPVIEEFLNNWKVKSMEWHKQNYEKFLEYLKGRTEKKQQLEQWLKENNLKSSLKNEDKKRIKEKELEMGIDSKTHAMILKMRFNNLTIKLYDNYKNSSIEREKMLEKEIEKEKNNKRALFISRVKEITGKIQDASNLNIGLNGEINGIVIGEQGKARVETISAGGYNIQCFHYRVLVKEVKEKL